MCIDAYYLSAKFIFGADNEAIQVYVLKFWRAVFENMKNRFRLKCENSNIQKIRVSILFYHLSAGIFVALQNYVHDMAVKTKVVEGV